MRAQATTEQGSAAKNRLIGATETVEGPTLAVLRIIGNLHQRAAIHIRINQFLIMEGIVLGAIRERLQALRLVAHRKEVLRSVSQPEAYAVSTLPNGTDGTSVRALMIGYSMLALNSVSAYIEPFNGSEMMVA